MPSPSAMPRTNAVLPAPRSPVSRTTAPGAQCRARAPVRPRPSPARTASFAVTTRFGVPLRAAGQLEHGIAEVTGDVGRRSWRPPLRRLPRGRRPARAGTPPSLHAASASRSCASHAATTPVSTSPVPAGRHAGIACRVDEDLAVRRRDQGAMALEDHVARAARRRNFARSRGGLPALRRATCRRGAPSRPDAA